MHPLHFPLLANENIHDDVVHFIRQKGLFIESIKERNLRGTTDAQILALAQAEGKVILTHDADFGRMLYFSQGIQTGVVFLRPGHIDPAIDNQTIESLLITDIEAQIPFILVAERSGNDIKIRLRKI